MSSDHAASIRAFITKWSVSGAAERANAQLFIAELCDVLGVEHPQPKKPDEAANSYVFEKTIPSHAQRPSEAPVPSTQWVDTPTSNFIDCYKRGHFVLETKQGADRHTGSALSEQGQAQEAARKTGHGIRGTKGWDTAMLKAREQAQRYARALPKEEIADGRPPFVIVVDVGHSIALYTDWTRMGGEYLPYPDPASYRIPLKDLLRSEVRDLLRAVWTDPLSLDPGRRSAKVTREIADRLAKLARSLERDSVPAQGRDDRAGMTAEAVANFLMRCLFTMFSEDVDLLPHGSFTALLGELKDEPGNFKEMLENLWGTMNTGGLSPILRKKLPRFNGGLFAHADAIALNADQIQLLIEASTANWKDVEPAIFGTLLERALDPRERHKLGAHYTPRAYVERLVVPTVIEPLRAQWASVQVAALQLADAGEDKKAIKQIEAFLHQLATVKVLDPACGSGNFLYVTLELLKRLEGEVLNTLHDLGATSKLELEGVMVTPANFFGIELNPRAAAIAEQVLWIGFLQWHLRTHGNLHNLPEPIIKDLHNIQNRDAVLDYDDKTEQRDTDGQVVTRWDGVSTKTHPVTGEQVPDADARVPVYTYSNPKPAKWPAADYIVGNPPFIGARTIRTALGDSYVEALREAYPEVPSTCDFVLYWWHQAASLVAKSKITSFGLITTNSITQAYSRKLIDKHLTGKSPVRLRFAIADHPWVESSEGAAVRIAMTVGVSKKNMNGRPVLGTVLSEDDGDDHIQINEAHVETIDSSLSASLSGGYTPLKANATTCFQGVVPAGEGFKLEVDDLTRLGLHVGSLPRVVRRYIIGKDLVQQKQDRFIIDFFSLSEEEARTGWPALYQHLRDTVYPVRLENKREVYKTKWWVFAEPRPKMRAVLATLPKRYIATPYTAKFRPFVFVDLDVLPDAMAYAVALDDAYYMGVLSSHVHAIWCKEAGGTLEDRQRYNSSQCFDPFPFPAATPAQQAKIRALGEQLDAHRKRQQAQHPELTMTGMYNVLERVRELEGERVKEAAPLCVKEKTIYEQGLVGILKQLHDELDAAVAEAYGWADLYAPRHAGGRVIEDHLSRPSGVSPMSSHRTADPESPKSRTDEILTRLVALNAERAAEEAKGQVRWLRPEYQMRGAGAGAGGKQTAIEAPAPDPAPAPAPATWPADLPAQAAALSEVLGTLPAPATVDEIAAHFEGKRTKKRLEEMTKLLETLVAVGRALKAQGDTWSTT